MAEQSLKEFYRDKTIFVTGAMGFVGRLLIAKLMRLGNVKQILILSRPKRGKTNQERLKKLFSGFLFQEMDKYDKSFHQKVRIINGDMEADMLGISEADAELLRQNTEIIIHCAATVKFDERLSKAISINIQGTKTLLDIALEVKNLLRFVYISTAYSQCPNWENIKEIFYEPPMHFRRALELPKSFDTDVIDALTRHIITPWPNTYTFTKAVTESMIKHYQTQLPLAVVRPSIRKHKFISKAIGILI